MVSTFFFYCECLIAHLISPGYHVLHSFLPYATFFIRFHSFPFVFASFHSFSPVFVRFRQCIPPFVHISAFSKLIPSTIRSQCRLIHQPSRLMFTYLCSPVISFRAVANPSSVLATLPFHRPIRLFFIQTELDKRLTEHKKTVLNHI